MAKAIDRRQNTFVTLKFYNNEELCHKELDMIGLIDGLGDTQSRTLKF